MNVLEFVEMLIVDTRKAVSMWGLSPAPPPGVPMGTPNITLPVVRLEIAIVKLREAWFILHECQSAITVLNTFADAAWSILYEAQNVIAAAGVADAADALSVETRMRIAGRVRALRDRMMQFQLVQDMGLGHSWVPTSEAAPTTTPHLEEMRAMHEQRLAAGLRMTRRPLTYGEATDLAKRTAQRLRGNGNAPSYLKDCHMPGWSPHAWVIEAIIEASR